MAGLLQIEDAVGERVREIAAAHAGWPCRKGCDECCRRLAAAPRVSGPEWERMSRALEALPADTAEAARRRIRESKAAAGPAVCPLLDRELGTCLIYEARPVACRAYGFYADRGAVLGCGRIEAMAAERADIVWGNHAALEEWLDSLGEAQALAEWLGRQEGGG